MKARRLLIVCYFYPPLAGGGVHRVLAFTRHLPALGWNCTVVCAGPEDYWVTDSTLEARIPDGTEVLRVSGGSAMATWLRFRRAPAGSRSGGTFRGLRSLADWLLLPDSYAGWARRARAVADARIARGDIDALLSTSPPDSVHLAARQLAARHRRPWLADFRDPWIGLHFRQPPTRWHRARHVALERDVLSAANVTLAASRTHADDLVASAVARRVVHLPNGFEPDASPAANEAGDGFFRLAFTGTLSQMPEVGTALEAVHDLLARRPEARRKLRVDLVGPFDTDYADRATALGLTGIVTFLGARAHAESRAVQARADALLLWKPTGAGYRTMVPGKLYEYLDTGRPILALLDPQDEAALLTRRAGGVVCVPGDHAGLAAAIESRYTAWRERGREPAARPNWLDALARPALAATLVGELNRLMGDPA